MHIVSLCSIYSICRLCLATALGEMNSYSHIQTAITRRHREFIQYGCGVKAMAVSGTIALEYTLISSQVRFATGNSHCSFVNLQTVNPPMIAYRPQPHIRSLPLQLLASATGFYLTANPTRSGVWAAIGLGSHIRYLSSGRYFTAFCYLLEQDRHWKSQHYIRTTSLARSAAFQSC